MLAAVNFGVFAPGFFHVSASLLDHVIAIEPTLQMSTAEFALFVLLIAGTLIELLDLYLVFGKLRSLR